VDLLAASLVCIVFLLACIALRLIPIAGTIAQMARTAIVTMRDQTLDDDAKELAARSAAIGLFGGFVSIVWRAAAALVASLAVLYGGDWLGIIDGDAVVTTLASWSFLIGTTVIITFLWVVVGRWRARTAT